MSNQKSADIYKTDDDIFVVFFKDQNIQMNLISTSAHFSMFYKSGTKQQFITIQNCLSSKL
jgi:hypothetical protein